MKTLLAAGLTCIALTATPALAGDEGGDEEGDAYVTPQGTVVRDTTSSAGGIILPIIFLLLVSAAAAD